MKNFTHHCGHALYLNLHIELILNFSPVENKYSYSLFYYKQIEISILYANINKIIKHLLSQFDRTNFNCKNH